MRIWHWVTFAFLLLTLSANAQQSANPSSSPATEQTVVPPNPAQPREQVESQPPSIAPQPITASASTALAMAPSSTMDQVVDRALRREHALMEMLKTRTPFVETYLQDLKFVPQLGPTLVQDHYYLGRMDLSENMDRRDYLSKETSFESHLLGGFTRLFRFEYRPLGFSWMIYADRSDFNRKTYDFKYIHREFLGDVRCMVFEVSAKKGTGKGRFRGRMWVEDQDYNIVRLNGFYEPRPRNAYFFHLDSWRLNLIPDYRVPAYIYSEEGDFADGSKDKMAFKAQTRLWGYDVRKGGQNGEFTQMRVDSTVEDVLPDEASLAMVLSHELAHIVLGHNLGSKYAFNDRMLFSDESVYQNFGFRHVPEEETAADKKALDLLKNSPYAQKLDTPGLFLREVAARGAALSALLTPHLGNGFTNRKGSMDRMVPLMNSAPALDPDKLSQIAALPLGGRVRLNAWYDHTELMKTTPLAITSARGKMPLEVTPFFPKLTRYGAVVNAMRAGERREPNSEQLVMNEN